MAKADATIPIEIARGFSELLESEVVCVTRPLSHLRRPELKGWFSFESAVFINVPEGSEFPREVDLEVLVPPGFPYAPVEIFPLSPEVRGYPHQDSETGKLCLKEERLAPTDPGRLRIYVQWAVEWLNDAASGQLLPVGDPYELPDFSRREMKGKMPYPGFLLFQESAEDFSIWGDRIGHWGRVSCGQRSDITAVFPLVFKDRDGNEIRSVKWGSCISDSEKTENMEAFWVLLRTVVYERHRPAQRWGEIRSMAESHGIELESLLKEAWKNKNGMKNIAIVLVGFPIGERVGDPPNQVHWQILSFHDHEHARENPPAGFRKGRTNSEWEATITVGTLSENKEIAWGKSFNVSRERLFARGAIPPDLSSKRAAIFGCGALGGRIAENLMRGGLQDLVLLDGDTLMPGNLCRHNLTAVELLENKAEALANRLALASPLAKVTGYGVNVPVRESDGDGPWDAMRNSGIWIDCTASESASEWLNSKAQEIGKTLVLVFITFGAKYLCICCGQGAVSCKSMYQEIVRLKDTPDCPIPADFFDQPAREAQVIEGAGCWHPTFPASAYEIDMLAAFAVERICEAFSHGSVQSWALVAQHETPSPNIMDKVMKVVWSETFA